MNKAEQIKCKRESYELMNKIINELNSGNAPKKETIERTLNAIDFLIMESESGIDTLRLNKNYIKYKPQISWQLDLSMLQYNCQVN